VLEVPIELTVLERLAARLELWSIELSDGERRLLLSLLGLGSVALAASQAPDDHLADQLGTSPYETEVAGFALISPSFADALSPAADAVALGRDEGRSVSLRLETPPGHPEN
jgi:hypothetical protein